MPAVCVRELKSCRGWRDEGGRDAEILSVMADTRAYFLRITYAVSWQPTSMLAVSLSTEHAPKSAAP